MHAAVFSAAAVATLTMGSASTSAAPTVQEGRYLAGGTTNLTYTCSGGDQTTIDLLGVLGLASFTMPVSITTASVEPSPSPGEDFDVAFTWDFTIDPAVEKVAFDVQVAYLDITEGVQSITATAGATGDVTGNGETVRVNIGDGSVPIGYTQGPFTGTFTRTAAVDEPIEFTPGVVTSTVITSSNIPLVIACTPGEAVLTMQDQDGVAPSTTTTTRPIVTTTVPATTTTVAVAGVQQLPRTGTSSNLLLVLLALGLIDLGYLAWSAGQMPRAQRTPSGR
ncbi:MAG: hypothetical protein ACOYXM_07540 [Actinomycetota bacterium]